MKKLALFLSMLVATATIPVSAMGQGQNQQEQQRPSRVSQMARAAINMITSFDRAAHRFGQFAHNAVGFRRSVDTFTGDDKTQESSEAQGVFEEAEESVRSRLRDIPGMSNFANNDNGLIRLGILGFTAYIFFRLFSNLMPAQQTQATNTNQ